MGASNQVNEKSDRFCFSCHRNISTENDEQSECTECVGIEQDRQELQAKNIDADCLQSLLKGVLYTLTSFVGDSAAKFPLEMSKITENVDAGTYTCLEEFLLDVKQILHNANVNPVSDDNVDQKTLVKAASRLIDAAKEDLYHIRLCHSCFLHAFANGSRDDGFTMVCEQPHLVVYAKMKYFPLWPAKLMKADPKTNKVDVIFFGDNNRAVLTQKDCMLYSQEHPSNNLGNHKGEIEKAQQEASAYIANVVEKFGAYNYAEIRTPLNIGHLDRHLYETIENAWKALGKPVPDTIPAAMIKMRRNSVLPKGASMNTPSRSSRRKSVLFTPINSMKSNGESVLHSKETPINGKSSATNGSVSEMDTSANSQSSIEQPIKPVKVSTEPKGKKRTKRLKSSLVIATSDGSPPNKKARKTKKSRKVAFEIGSNDGTNDGGDEFMQETTIETENDSEAASAIIDKGKSESPVLLMNVVTESQSESPSASRKKKKATNPKKKPVNPKKRNAAAAKAATSSPDVPDNPDQNVCESNELAESPEWKDDVELTEQIKTLREQLEIERKEVDNLNGQMRERNRQLKENEASKKDLERKCVRLTSKCNKYKKLIEMVKKTSAEIDLDQTEA